MSLKHEDIVSCEDEDTNKIFGTFFVEKNPSMP